MKIAQIAPLAERCPPSLYGGTERIVSYVAEELMRQGHEVTLFASRDSATLAELVPCCEVALRLDTRVRDPLPYYLMMLDRVMAHANRFDVLHFHIDLMHFPLLRRMPVRAVTTLHGRLDLPDLQPFYARFPHFPLVSVSNAQRAPMPPVNWAVTVYHGLPAHQLSCCANPRGDYLGVPGPDLARKGSRSCDRNRRACWAAPEDRRQDRPRGSRLLGGHHPPTGGGAPKH